MKFKSKLNINWILGGIIMLVGTGIVMIPFVSGYYTTHNEFVQFGLLSVLIMDALFVWIMLDRHYTLHEDTLEIKYGCFLHLHLRYEDIKEFHEIKKLKGVTRYMVEGVSIAFQSKNAKTGTDVIHIAPAHIHHFLDVLKEKTMVLD